MIDGRQPDLLLPQPEMNLPDALELGELAKHQADRFADPQVRILLDPVMPDFDVANRDGEKQLAAPCLLAQGLERALAQKASSISLIVPFMPNRSRSFGSRTSYDPTS